MRTCPFSSHLSRTYQSALNCLPALSFPCLTRSQCWESQFVLCGLRTPALRARRLTNTLPLLLLPLPPLSSGSPFAHPQPTICAVKSLRLCQSPSASRLEDALSSPPASESRTSPQSVDPAAPPWLLAPSSPLWPISPPGPPGSLVPPAPPWLVVDHLSHRDSTPPAAPRPSGSVRLLPPSQQGQQTEAKSSTCSTAIVRPPWSRQPFLHHGSSLFQLYRR